MMKMKIYLLAVTSLLLVNCNSENITMPEDNTMRIEVLHPSVTRATETAFEFGDKIGLYASEYDETSVPLQISGNWTNNVAVTYDGESWNPSKTIFWSEKKMDVYGYYPYMNPTSIKEHVWPIQLDQSTVDTETGMSAYEASDFLWAKATGVSKADDEVELQFNHRCSKLVVKLIKGSGYKGEFPDVSELLIHNTVPTAAINFTNGAVTKYVYGETATIKARKVSNDTFEAIVVPQRVESRRPFLEYIANDVSFLYESTFVFKAGKQHTLELTINSNPDQINIDISGKVENWQ